MRLTSQWSYFRKSLFAFLLLIFCAISIYLIGNYLIHSIKTNVVPIEFNNYIFKPTTFLFLIIALIKDIIVSTLLIHTLFYLVQKKIKASEILYYVLIANFIFIAQNIFDLIWVNIHKNEFRINQLLDFQSLSIFNLFKSVPNYLYHATVTTNLWELIYIILLAFLLKKDLNRSFIKSFGLVFLAYGIPLILWMIFVTFIQISNA